MIYAGKLDKRITFLKPTKSIVNGKNTVVYEDYKKVWANVKQITLRESIQSNVELSTETYTVLCRYVEGIGADWCIEYKSLRYRIVSINTLISDGSMIIGIELDNSIVQEVKS